jgi:hypothetical protein
LLLLFAVAKTTTVDSFDVLKYLASEQVALRKSIYFPFYVNIFILRSLTFFCTFSFLFSPLAVDC